MWVRIPPGALKMANRPEMEIPNMIVLYLRMQRILREPILDYPHLPDVPKNPLPSDLAQYAQVDWKELQRFHRHKYETGLFRYEYYFAETLARPPEPDVQDWIAIRKNWLVEHGRHRTLALKMLGPDFVRQSGMDNWIKVTISNPL